MSAYWQGGTFLLRRWNLPFVFRDDSWKGIAVCHLLTQTRGIADDGQVWTIGARG